MYAHKNIHITGLSHTCAQCPLINSDHASGTPNKTEDRANTIDWLIRLFNTPAWQGCYIGRDKKRSRRAKSTWCVTMRMMCRFIPKGILKREISPRRVSIRMAICHIRQTCRSRIHKLVSSKRTANVIVRNHADILLGDIRREAGNCTWQPASCRFCTF